MILGGDYSKWDPVVDWENHTWKYAFIKVSEGIVEDRVFPLQWEAARNHVYRGGYHFFRPLVSWKLAAEKFMYLMDREGLGELPPVLDLEVMDGVNNKDIRARALEWLRYVHRESGQRPIVYTSPGYANTIQLYLDTDFADYFLWEATYPWDTITATWTEAMRRATLADIIAGTYQYKFPAPARPWQDVGRPVTFAQFTGKCPPDLVPGYPLGYKLAVDVNAYKGSLLDLMFQFNLQPLEGEPPMSTKPVTWTAVLKPGQVANLRSGPGRTYAIKEPLANITDVTMEIKGTGVKLGPTDDYYWGEIISFNGVAKIGYIAFTTSLDAVVWLTTPPAPTPTPVAKKAVRTVIFYDDGSIDEMHPRL